MKQKTLFWALTMLLICFFVSCNNEEAFIENENPKQELSGTIYPSFYKFAPEGKQTKAAVVKDYKWRKTSINIKFASPGNTAAQDKIRAIVENGWQKHIGLSLIFRDKDPSFSDENVDVLVQLSTPSSGPDKANWSAIGSESRDFVQLYGMPSMNIVVTDLNSAEFKADVLRQFGHALGLIYEYQRKTFMNQGGIGSVIVSEKAIDEFFEGKEVNRMFWENAYLGTQYGKAQFDVPRNASGVEVNWTFDPKSIMLPYIPGAFTIGGTDVLTTSNNDLSTQDIAYISAVYPKLEPDAYKKGETGTINVKVLAASELPGSMHWHQYGVWAWDFENNNLWTNLNYSTQDYTTIGVGEYEWMSADLRIKYRNIWQTTMGHINHTQAQVDAKLPGVTGLNVKEFDKLFGSWATEHDVCKSYRNGDAGDVKFERLTGYSGADVKFDLPDATAVLQMVGQTPRRPGKSLVEDFGNFVYGFNTTHNRLITSAQWTKIRSIMYLVTSSENISGLSQMPLGSRRNTNSVDDINDQFGTAFGWKIKGSAKNFGVSTIYGVHLNGSNHHYNQVRYCRMKSPAELNYDIFVDETTGDVVKQSIRPAGYRVVEKGLERGIALRWAKGDKVLKSWSEIQEEAKDIRSEMGFYNW